MNIEKLIEQLNGYFEGKELGRGAALDAATVLSTFQAENEKLQKMYQEEKVVCHATQVELEKVRESLDFARTKDAEILRLGMELGHLKKHMERLTHRLGNGEITCNMARDDCRKMGGDCQIDSKILDRLAAYEETGLEPEEIDRILDAYGRGDDSTDRERSEIGNRKGHQNYPSPRACPGGQRGAVRGDAVPTWG